MSSDMFVLAVALAGAGALLFFRPLRSRMGHVTAIPWQVYRIATDPRLRRNHALEHATLNVLECRHGRPEVNGVAVQAGFILRGLVNPHHIVAAAEEGLRRLQAGDTAIAFHPQCGTSIGTAELLTWTTLVVLLSLTGRLSWLALLLGLALTYLIAPVVGRLVQQRLTTTTSLEGVEVIGVTVRSRPQTRGPWTTGSDGAFWGEVVVLVKHAGDPDLGIRLGGVANGP